MEAKCHLMASQWSKQTSFLSWHPEVTVTHKNCIAKFLAHTWRVLIGLPQLFSKACRWYLVNLRNFYIRNPSCIYIWELNLCRGTPVSTYGVGSCHPKTAPFSPCKCRFKTPDPLALAHNSARRRPKAKEASTRLDLPSTRTNRDTLESISEWRDTVLATTKNTHNTTRSKYVYTQSQSKGLWF